MTSRKSINCWKIQVKEIFFNSCFKLLEMFTVLFWTFNFVMWRLLTITKKFSLMWPRIRPKTQKRHLGVQAPWIQTDRKTRVVCLSTYHSDMYSIFSVTWAFLKLFKEQSRAFFLSSLLSMSFSPRSARYAQTVFDWGEWGPPIQSSSQLGISVAL